MDQEEARARFQTTADCWDEVEEEGAGNRVHRAGSEKISLSRTELPDLWVKVQEDESPPR